MNNKSKLTSYFSALFFVLAIMFSSNINAATAVGGDESKKSIRKGHRGYGQDRHEQGRGRGHYSHGNGHGYGHHKDKHDSIPLDGGLAILVLGAAAFGIKKLRGDKNS